jgi:aconitate decarboxylase
MADHFANDNPYTRRMAAFISGLRYEQIPKEVIDRIKLLILDSLGCGIYGARLEWSRILIDTLRRLDNSTACGVWGTPMKLSAPHAVLVNGAMVQGFELDDVHRVGVMHVGAVTLPPLIALAEMRPGLTGRDFLTAAVAGYEIGPRVGMCMGPEHIGQGWHQGATVGVFSASAGVASALQLTEEQTIHALGIAGTQAAGLMAAQYGSMAKRMHAGRSAQSGLYGALLAEAGYTGIVNIFESEYGGFCTTFSRSHDRFNLAELTSGLGERFETMHVSLKFYSCVGSNHTTLDAIRKILALRRIAVGDIDQIIVHASQVTVDHVGWKYHPNGVTAAQLNLAFCVATLLLEGAVFVDQFSDKALTNPLRIALAKRIRVVPDARIVARGSKYRHMVRVEVILKDGNVLEQTVEVPRGSEQQFAAKDEIVEKFEKLTAHALQPEHVASIREAVLHLEQLPDVATLTHMLALDWQSGPHIDLAASFKA